MLVTKNLTPGEAVYGEKRISVEGPANEDGAATKVEYRVWNPFRSKVNFPSKNAYQKPRNYVLLVFVPIILSRIGLT